ncbi:helix-turn-helix domain containing protein [Irregularibacter muris]|uniref:Helix-turn-helix domain containing protein n=1 Tax=Irregularibacter muris TaxID=1796619 RepID=A0AAE3HJM7_9FIRM|nr:helix-turn-helix domain-containing protein [Irregularibacter muris]MCR1900079.1 helix-turn-helix domain containing protein [Irregularibacter muris]
MGRKNNILYEVKVMAMKDYFKGLKSVKRISEELNINVSTVKTSVKIYCTKGESGLLPKKIHNTYSKELKQAAIEDYFAGKDSQWDISLKYGLSSHAQL